MKFIVILCLLLLSYALKAQKQIIELDTYKSWNMIDDGKITNDGEYIAYTLKNTSSENFKLCIKSSSNNWLKEYENITESTFTEDSRYFIGKDIGDTLMILNLVSKKENKIAAVANYELYFYQHNGYLAYQESGSRLFHILKLGENSSVNFNDVIEYKIGPGGESILLYQKKHTDLVSEQGKLSLYSSKTKNIRLIYSGNNIKRLIFDDLGNQVAFMQESESDIDVGYCNINNQAQIISSSTIIKDTSTRISNGRFEFSKDGSGIFLNLVRSPILKRAKISNVQIWNYEDRYLQTQEKINSLNLSSQKQYLSKLDLATHNLEQLITENENLASNGYNHLTDEWIVVEDIRGNLDEPFLGTNISYSLHSTKTGLKYPLDTSRSTRIRNLTISPNAKYIVYYDSQTGCFYSYNIANKTKHNLSSSIATKTYRYDYLTSAKPSDFQAGIIGWIKDEALLIRGTFDIWALDPTGIKQPTNLTSNIGEENKIVFRNALRVYDIKWDDNLLLSSFDTKSKEEGFYLLSLSKKNSISKIYSSRFAYFQPNIIYRETNYSSYFLKAKNAKKYLLLRQTADNAPNYYISSDLKSYKQLTYNQPQVKYNWLTSELHQYPDSVGNMYQGILYKPENFDSTKKYPIIFQYYIRQSNFLNIFPTIEPAPVNFNIAMAVSKGYLVFCPDIITPIGEPGRAALTSIMSSVKYLNRYKWIDTSKMGISGHSFAGYETNFIVTHTNIFCAAISCAGNSELISMAYEIWPEFGWSKESYYTLGPCNLGQSFADAPELYRRNSPLFYASNISTPILLLHNTNDIMVPFRQTRQFFIMLRSLKKPAWWLNYEAEGHQLSNEENIIDYNHKVFDFLDHFLKNEKMPDWMKQHN